MNNKLMEIYLELYLLSDADIAAASLAGIDMNVSMFVFSKAHAERIQKMTFERSLLRHEFDHVEFSFDFPLSVFDDLYSITEQEGFAIDLHTGVATLYGILQDQRFNQLKGTNLFFL
jgi:hypothetical protein